MGVNGLKGDARVRYGLVVCGFVFIMGFGVLEGGLVLGSSH